MLVFKLDKTYLVKGVVQLEAVAAIDGDLRKYYGVLLQLTHTAVFPGSM